MTASLPLVPASRERRRVDAVVLGGGPAGSATALALLRSGKTVAIIERTRYDDVRIGETLPPESRRFLAALDVLARFEEEGHVVSPGITSAWGSDEPADNDFIFNPFGHGWHIDRRRFDRMLAIAAEERGAILHLGARASAAGAGERARWSVLARAGAKAWSYECDHVVDAAGRAPLPFGPRRRRSSPGDELAAVVGIGAAAGPGDGRTVLEAAELGWWYGARLPGERVIATFTTDPGLVGRDVPGFWRDQMRRTRLVAGWLRDPGATAIRVLKCSTYLRTPVARDGWVAVGDAASGFDPLSSLGLCKALESGIRAGRAIGEGRLAEYEDWVESSFRQHLATRAYYYGLERRWPASSFWRARQGAEAAPSREPHP